MYRAELDLKVASIRAHFDDSFFFNFERSNN